MTHNLPLARLRHPCILEVVEPFEESRNQVMFATEPVISTLQTAAADARSELDEVEIQKGLLQVARALEFVHATGYVHTDVKPASIVINNKGDWKLASFAYLSAVTGPDATDGCWAYENDSDEPALARSLDYADPAHVIDRNVSVSNDMFSLGVTIFSLFNEGRAPWQYYGSVSTLRSTDHLSVVMRSSQWASLGSDLQSILQNLLQRQPAMRYSAKMFQTLPYFNSLLVSVLKFIERDSFAAHGREEKVQFLRGLLKMLPQFSAPLLRRKLLPSLLDLIADRALLPYILPNVFAISKGLSSLEFTTKVLPRIRPLFDVQDPPQTQMLLLTHTDLYVSKTSPKEFRETIMPLLYSAFQSEHVAVQENALQRIPRLVSLLEYTHVSEQLFPRLLSLFGKTKILSVKVSCLICLHSVVPILDKQTLSEKLVPTLARIKTREASVMISALAVHEAMASKLDVETLAISVLPQLWVMSMCPNLNTTQFGRFMRVVRDIGTRVEKEHTAQLHEAQQLAQSEAEHITSARTSMPDSFGAAVAPSSVTAADVSLSMAEIVGHRTGPAPQPPGDSLLDDFSSAFTAVQPAAALSTPAAPGPRLPPPPRSNSLVDSLLDDHQPQPQPHVGIPAMPLVPARTGPASLQTSSNSQSLLDLSDFDPLR
ncbi:Protein kinase domain-containing protein ppk32 [Malassezia cuniculi]|uniref:Protein kinase domain-containing protein ppk32 n=1 Tax=Malassezia cuniculi TaxID=948313 RepID=A0AAF0EQH1_9BASI|nr:Protein kinase domain-containing protein ppk32 [Malassezia cuniculi]